MDFADRRFTKSYFADYILAYPSFPAGFIQNGEIVIDDLTGKIISIRKQIKDNKRNESGFRALIVPGFINAHTHTDLTIKPDDSTPKIFSRWVLSLMEKRKSIDNVGKNKLRVKAFRDFVKSGTTLIGDIIEPDGFEFIYESFRDIKANIAIPRIKGFIELRDLDPDKAGERTSELKSFYKKNIANFKKIGNSFSLGLSPHSVYSVSENLFNEIRKENLKLHLKTAIHASEHCSEIQYISGHGGDIASNLLPAFNLAKFSIPAKIYATPISYLNNLNMLNENTLLIHANEINDNDIEIVKKSGVSIVHCPRSNSFFNSRKLPLSRLIKEGINVSLGTDSLYSNDSLSIIDEIKYARKVHPDVSSKDLFAMATVNGAAALSFPDVTGKLEPDSYADFIAFKINNNINFDKTDIFDFLMSLGEKDIIYVVINGDVAYNNYI